MGGSLDLGVVLGLAVTDMMGDRRYCSDHVVGTSTHSVPILVLWQWCVVVAVLVCFCFCLIALGSDAIRL